MTAAQASTVYRRHQDVVTRDILGETLLVPISTAVADMDNVYALNETGAFVWQRLDGATPVADILDAVIETFDAESDAVSEDVAALLEDLASCGLIEPVS